MKSKNLLGKKWKKFAFVAFCGAFLGMTVPVFSEISKQPDVAFAKETTDIVWQEETTDITKGNLVFHTRLSEQGDYAWIVNISQVEKKELTKLEFPDKIKEATVIKIGQEPQEGDDYRNIWGSYVEPYHDVDCYDKMPKGIREVVLPSHLQEICSASFCGFRELTSIKIPSQVQTIPYAAFYRCEKLKKVVLPKNLQTMESQAFKKCGQLTKITISEQSKRYTCQDGVLYSKDKKTFVWFAVGRKKLEIPSGVTTIQSLSLSDSKVRSVSIPSSVKKIEKNALSGKKIKKITISEKNSRYKKSGNCIYDKKTKSLSVVLCKDGTVVLPKEVKYLTSNVSTAGASIQTLYISKNFKGFRKNCFDNGLRMAMSARICLESTTPPSVQKGCFCSFSTYYVPKKSLKKYQTWYMKAENIKKLKNGFVNFCGY